MTKKGEGFLVFKKNIKDNDLFIKLLSKNDELISGIVYGGNSSKKKTIYQIGYFIEYSIIQKNKNAPFVITGEIIKPYISSIINDQFKSYSLLGLISLVNNSILEGQKLSNLYISVKDLVDIISKNNKWISFYCVWLFNLLKIIGYQIDYTNKKDFKYFNLFTQDFEKLSTNKSIIFPHRILRNKENINFNEIKAVFTIFKSIYTKNHLDNINYKMPINFINFEKKIINTLERL